MKKILLLVVLVFFMGCEEKKESKVETFSYKSESGVIEIPKKAMRIVSLNMGTSGDFIAFSENVVGVEKWTKENPTFKELAKDIQVISDEDLEGIIKLNPDLIITASTDKNIEKLKKIAPTVTFSYGKLDYISRMLEVGKILNKEKEVEEWINSYKTEAKELGEKVKKIYGKDVTVTIVESQNKQLYVFGDNFGRGGEILYKEMGLNQPLKVKENIGNSGFYAVSSEVLPEFIGDFLVYVKGDGTTNSLEETALYTDIPAVKNNRVILGDIRSFFFNDPVTLRNQLNLFKKKFSESRE